MSRDIEEMESRTSSDTECFEKGISKVLVPMLCDVGLVTLTSGSNKGLLLQGELEDSRGMLAPGGAQ